MFREAIADAIQAISFLKEEVSLAFLEKVVLLLTECFSLGRKVLIAGNGGSLCDAMHFAEELTGFYRKKRAPLAALALCDPGHMSCVANDTSFAFVFSRSVEALGMGGDLLILLSTSGNSENLIEAAKVAQKRDIQVIGFLGKEGGKLKQFCDLFWIVKGCSFSDRIQEVHMAAIHMIIEEVEKRIFFR